MLNDNDMLLLGTYFISWFVMLYLFGMQRATLLISRTNNVDWKDVGVHLLPKWYPITFPLWQDSCHYLKFNQLGR